MTETEKLLCDRLSSVEDEVTRLHQLLERRQRREQISIRWLSFWGLVLLTVAACIGLNKLAALLGEDLGDILQLVVNLGSMLTLLWGLVNQRRVGEQVERVIEKRVEKERGA